MTSTSIQFQWFRFENLSAEQLYAVMQLRQNVFVVEQRCCYQDLDGLDAVAIHLLATDTASNQLVAYCRLFGPHDRFAEPSIGRILTAATHRGQGLGHELVRRGVAYCDQHFADHPIRIAAQAHLDRFYGHHGFTPVGDTYDIDDIPHVDLIRQPPRSS
jgi:ElaA protein